MSRARHIAKQQPPALPRAGNAFSRLVLENPDGSEVNVLRSLVLHVSPGLVLSQDLGEDGVEYLAQTTHEGLLASTSFEVGDEWQAFTGENGKLVLARCATPSLTDARRLELEALLRWWLENSEGTAQTEHRKENLCPAV